jgi:exonuclease III
VLLHHFLWYVKFLLLTSTVPNSGQKLERLKYRTEEWDHDVIQYLIKLQETKPVVWCGDLNVAILDIDVHNPKGNVSVFHKLTSCRKRLLVLPMKKERVSDVF